MTLRFLLIGILACPLSAGTVSPTTAPAHTPVPVLTNPFEQPGTWYKAGLHIHTSVSDGDKSPSERIKQYREKGYSILAFTDHNKSVDPASFSSEDLLVIRGMEIHPFYPTARKTKGRCHLVGLNVPPDLNPFGIRDINRQIAAIKQAGGEVIFAHPYWSGFTAADIFPIKGLIGIEVFNHGTSRAGKAYSSVHWDDLLDAGATLPALAVDDTHFTGDVGQGYVMIKAANLKLETVMNALRTGSYYASCGPAITDFRVRDGKVVIQCSPVAEIHLLGQKSNGAVFTAGEGPDLTAAQVNLTDFDADLKYLRAEVVDRKGKHAWTNPLFFKSSLAVNHRPLATKKGVP